MHTSLQGQQDMYIIIAIIFEKGITQQSLINQNSTVYLNWIQLKKFTKTKNAWLFSKEFNVFNCG